MNIVFDKWTYSNNPVSEVYPPATAKKINALVKEHGQIETKNYFIYNPKTVKTHGVYVKVD